MFRHCSGIYGSSGDVNEVSDNSVLSFAAYFGRAVAVREFWPKYCLKLEFGCSSELLARYT
jgi:hypothetical protein